MSENFKCDRCNAEISVQRGRFEVTDWIQVSTKSIRNSQSIGAFCPSRELHLCATCADDFNGFISGERR